MFNRHHPVRLVLVVLSIIVISSIAVSASWSSDIANTLTFGMFSSGDATTTSPDGTIAPAEPMFTVITPSTANYAFTTNTTGSLAVDRNGNAVDLSVGSSSLVGPGLDDAVSPLTNIGFDFYFMGTRYAQFSTSDNGVVQLGSAVSATLYSFPSTTLPIISPFGEDMKTGTDGIVRSKVVGTAPNRTLIIEHSNIMVRFLATSAPGTGTWQTRLYESSGIIEFVYGAMSTNSAGQNPAYVGFSSGTANNTFLSITTSSQTPNTTGTVASNLYASSVVIGDLNSTANGARRRYTFVPPPTPTSPTGLSFTSVTTTGMTLNWSDSPDEVGYAVYRSTDGGSTYAFQGATASDVTTLAVTALQPGQTYNWRVYGLSEGALSSAPLSGSQATTAVGGTYFWVGASGGDFNTGTNWNTAADNTGTARGAGTTSDILIVDGAGTTAGAATTISVSASASIGALQISSNTACTLQSSTTTTRTITITGNNGTDLDIPAGNSLIMNNATQATAIAFSTSTGMIGNIAGTLTLTGAVANTVTTTGGTGTVVTVTNTGIVNLTGSVSAFNGLVGSAATLVFSNGSNCNSSVLTTSAPPDPLATWGANSTITINAGTSTTSPTNAAQTYGNFVYNSPASTGTVSFFTSTTTASVQGTLTIQATNTGKFRATTSGTVFVNNLVVSGGTLEVASTTGTLNVTSGVTQSGGIIDVTSGTVAANLKVAGGFNQSAGTLVVSGVSAANSFELNGSTAQNLTLSNPVTGPLNVRVNDPAGVNLTGALAINTNAGLTISNGNITGSGTITYGATATKLTYNSTNAAQTSNATEFPAASGPVSLTINNTNASPNNTVTTAFSRTLPATGVLTLTSGVLVNTGNLLTISNTATGGIVGGSATAYVRGAVARTLPLSLLTGSTYTFPIGKGTYNPFELVNPTTGAGGTVVAQAEAFDAGSGGTPGINMLSINTDRYWAASITSGAANFVNSQIKITDASVASSTAIAAGAVLAGAYDLVGGTSPTVVVGTSVTTQSPAATSIPGFYALGTKAVPMSYVSSTTTQAVTTPVLTNTTNQQIIGIQVVTVGNASPLTASSFSLNTTGTTAPGTDITNAKLWYTGTSGTFATTTQFGSTVGAPSGAYSITGSQILAEGTNFFWLTYDIPSGATPFNVVDAECTSVNPGTGAQTPTVTAPAGTRTIRAPLTGTYTVGPTQVAPNYTTLTAATTDLGFVGVSGPVVFQLAADYVSTGETFPITINTIPGGGAVNTVTVRPAAGATRTITGSSTGCIVKLNGADFVTIDGSNNGTATRDLTIANTNTGTSSAVVCVQSTAAADGATNNTIKNLIVTGNASTTTLGGIVSSGSALGGVAEAANTGNTYQNNLITASFYGMAVVGPNAFEANLITGNTVGSTVTASKIGFNGIAVFQQAGTTISANTVLGVTTSSSSRTSGINVTGTANGVSVIGNTVKDVKNTSSSGFGSNGIQLSSSSPAANVTVANNVITDVASFGFSSVGPDDNGYGILVNTGGGYNVYFNSVNLTTNQSAGVSAALNIVSTITTPATLNIRNNAFATAQTTNTRYAIYSSAANTVFSSIDYNDYFATTGGILGFIGINRTDLAGIQTGFGGNTSSIISDPKFTSSTDLRPQLGVSPLLGAGINGTGILTDILGVTRSVGAPPSGPTIGAYENAVDVNPPVITYTAFTNTTSTSSRSLTATITDGTGVDSGGNSPRIYFKKSSDPSFTFGSSTACSLSSGTAQNGTYNCLIDYSLISGGVAVTNTIQYFVIAQDTLGFVSSNPSAGLVASNVNTVTTAPTTPNSYSILTSVSGTYNVDAGGGGQALSLTNAGGLFSVINGGVVTGDITINIASDLPNELGTVALNEYAAPFVITIKPVGAVRTISGAATTSLIRLDGADRVVIDGSTSGGTDKSLIISNTSTSGAVLHVINNATGNLFKNLDLRGVTTSTTNGVVFVGTTATGTNGNNTNTFQANDIHSGTTAPGYGFYNSGSSTAKNTNNLISGNRVFDFSTNGIRDDGNSVTTTYDGNEIFEVVSQTTALVGFRPSATSVDGFTFSRNYIHDLNTSSTSNVYGVHIFDTSTLNTSVFSNNMITLGATAPLTLRGIYDQSATGEKYNLFFNSIYLFGTVTGASTSEAYYWSIASTTNASGNIFFNDRTGGTGKHYSYRLNTTLANLTSDYNDIFNSGGTANVFGNDGTADRADIAAWRTSTGKDTNSVPGNPAFVSASNLHITFASAAKNAGIIFGGITTDFDTNSRPQDGAYDIGADEYVDTNAPDTQILTNPTNPSTSTSATFTFSGTDSRPTIDAVASFECDIDGGGFTTCTTPKTYLGLSSGSHTFQVRAKDGSGNVDATPASYTWVINQAPAITAVPTSRLEGSAPSNSTIANVTDDGGNGAVGVTVNGGASATVNGVTVSNILNTAGVITADVVAPCGATSASFTLSASDGVSATPATLNVTVTASAPVLTYASPGSIAFGGSTTLNPLTGPADNGSVASIVIQSAGTYTGTISVDNTTGVVSISNAAPTGTHTITVRITDNCGTFTDATFDLTVGAAVSFAIDDVTHFEGNAGTTGYTFTVTKTGSTAITTTVDYTTANDTANAPSDYTAAGPLTLTFLPADTTKTFTILVNGDTGLELDEQFFVNLTNPANATISDSQGTGTILNDDCVTAPGGMVSWYSAENNALDINGPNNGTVHGGVTYGPGKVGGNSFDLNGTDGYIGLGNGATFQLNAVTTDAWISPDTMGIGDYETIVSKWQQGSDTSWGFFFVGTSPTTGRIDGYVNTPGGTVTTNGGVIPVGTGVYTHVTMSYSSGDGMRLYVNGVQVATAPATGIMTTSTTPVQIGTDSDLLASRFFDGRIDEVEIFDHALLAADVLSLANASGGGKCHTSTLQFGSPTYTSGEGAGNAVISVSRVGAHDTIAAVDYATVAGGTATGGAACGGTVDYQDTSGTLSFAANEFFKTFNVPVCPDAVNEPSETVNLALTNAQDPGITLGTQTSAVLTITDDDAIPAISIGDVTQAEGNAGTSTFAFNVTLDHASSSTVTVNYATADGLATTADNDYVAGSGTVTFIAGETSKPVNVTVNGDTKFENNEDFAVNLTVPVGASILDGQGIGSITNDDTVPTLSVNDVTQAEGNAGTSTFNFNVTLSQASGLPVTVHYQTADNTATTADGDYVAIPDTVLTIPAGSLSRTLSTSNVPVTVNGDTKFEGNETFFVNLTNPSGATISDNQGVGSITNDDTAPTISISDVTQAEGNAGTSVFSFNVTTSAVSGLPVTVHYQTANGTATTADNDYVGIGDTILTIPAGSTGTAGNVQVTVNGDTKFEGNEDFAVNLSTPTGATILDNQGVGSITNDDTAPTISISDVTQAEGNAGTSVFSFNVTTSAVSGLPVTVHYQTANGTATTADNDYVGIGDTILTIPAGSTGTAGNVQVTVNGDTKFEGNEDFAVNLSTPTGATILDNQGVGLINNDDTAPTISISDVTQAEGNAGTTIYSFNVTLSAVSGLPVTVHYQTADGTATTADNDYVGIGDTLLTIPAGSTGTAGNVQVTVNGDTKFEGNEDFTVNLSTPSGATILDNQGVGSITNDDTAPTISITDATQAEGNAGTSVFSFNVTLSAVSGLPVTVHYQTADGTATTADSDYVAKPDTILTIPAGSLSRPEIVGNIQITVNGDTKFEGNETFFVNLTNPSGATILDNQGLGTINNDDTAPTISITDVTLAEGNAGTTAFNFNVTTSAVSGLPVTVHYQTADGTATTADSDYVGVADTVLTIPTGSTGTAGNVQVIVNGDTKFEGNETFFVNLTNPSGATILDNQGLGTINNDDTAPTFAIDDVSLNEGDTGTTTYTFTVTKTGATGLPSSVDFASADGTAVSTGGSADFTAVSGTLNFAANVTTMPVTVLVNGDVVVEPTEAFTVHLSNPSGATISDTDGTGTINNDDAVPSLQFSAGFYDEDESQTAKINIHRTGDTSVASTVKFSTVAGGTAGGGAACGGASVDYVTVTDAIITFGIGVTDMPASVIVCGGDTLSEPVDTVNLQVTPDTNGTIGAQSTAVLRIHDSASEYRNTNPIDLTLGSGASPYPSQIVVSGAPTLIGSMRVTLFDVSHVLPDNIDVLLQGPGGQTYMLMGDAGGVFSIDPSAPVTLTFSDTSSFLLPDASQLTTGVFLPTTWEPGQSSFPAGAPAGPYTQAPSTVARPNSLKMYGKFGLTDANGTWKLWVRDDNGTSFAPEAIVGGIAGGWGIEFLAPTAAGVDVAGRVTTADGRGIRSAQVTLTDSHGVIRTVMSSTLGYYRFDSVATGDTYIIGVDSKRFHFTPRVVQVFDTLTDVDMIAQE